MSRDLPAGQTEIDYYNGHLIQLAGERPCPRNRLVYQFLKRMEQQRRPPDVTVLSELASAWPTDHRSRARGGSAIAVGADDLNV